ncbi:ImmA/IrrE family metallo-endopeptidase [Devosia sp. CAU 1758]
MKMLIVAVFVGTLFSGTSAFAQSFGNIPDSVSCRAPNAYSGLVVPVVQTQGPSQHWAHATYFPDGTPVIVYGPAYFGIPRYMRRFTSAHECGHLAIPTRNEYEANCFALMNLSLSRSDVAAIGDYHAALGPLPFQYGGSGLAFWAGTQSLCPHVFS